MIISFVNNKEQESWTIPNHRKDVVPRLNEIVTLPSGKNFMVVQVRHDYVHDKVTIRLEALD